MVNMQKSSIKRILIVEDDEDWLEQIKDAVKDNIEGQLKIDAARDCRSGIKVLTAASYDLAIIDIKLSKNIEKENGLCLLRVCSMPEKNVPAIVLSGILQYDGETVRAISQCAAVKKIIFKNEIKNAIDLVGVIKEYLFSEVRRKLTVDLNVFLKLKNKIMTSRYDVFMCHNRKDKDFVKTVSLQLIENGILPWLDQWEMNVGENWLNEMAVQMNEIGSAAIFLGNHKDGYYHIQEALALIKRMVEKKGRIIPIYMADYDGASVNLPFIDTLEAIDFRDQSADPMQRLINAFK